MSESVSNLHYFHLIVFTFFALLIVFLVCREIVCWYWKINRSIQLQEQILAELKTMSCLQTKVFQEDESKKNAGRSNEDSK